MKPPSNEAMGAAMHILLKSVENENADNQDSPPVSPDTQHERQLAQLNAATYAFRQYSIRMRADLNSSHNAVLSKIHGLPNELLVNVFMLTRHEMNVHNDPELLKTIAGVCSRWRTIVRGSPQLWNRVSSLSPITTVQLFLRKSEAFPLTISVYPNDATRFFRTISDSSFRWRTILWRGYLTQEAIVFLRELPPTVKRLSFALQTQRGLAPYSDLKFDGTAPFRHVSSDGVRLDWSCPRLISLSTLELAKVELSEGSALQLIAASLGVERLILQNITSPPNTCRNFPHHVPLELPALASLVVAGVAPSFSAALARTLSVPNAQLLFIDPLPGDTLAQTADLPLFRDMARLMGEVAQLILLARVEGTVVPNEVTIGSGISKFVDSWIHKEDKTGFYVAFRSDDVLDLLSHASTIVAFSRPTKPIILDVGSFKNKVKRSNPMKPTPKDRSKPDGLVIPSGLLSGLPMMIQIKIVCGFDPQALVDVLVIDDQLCPELGSLDFGEYGRYIDMGRFLGRRGGKIDGGVWTR